jgi:DNA-binding GntR family transcriptional regulator
MARSSRRATFATNVDFTELAGVSEIRELLEPLAARRAASRANQAMRREMLHVADTIARLDPSAAGSRDLMRNDLTVHRLIYRAAANPHLEDTLIRYDDLATARIMKRDNLR